MANNKQGNQRVALILRRVIKTDKNILRQEMKKKRREFDKKEEASKKACDFLMNLYEYKNASCVCVYMSAFGEVDTSHIIKDLKKRGKKIVLPITDCDTNTLSLSYFTDNLKKGAYGISEPENIQHVSISDVDFFVVPGICFDKKGGRIGFGKGYYDRLLKESKAFKAGLCYSFQITEEIALEKNDILMDAIVCEDGVVSVIDKN